MIKSTLEGNDCYKYNNLKRFIKETYTVKIQNIVDIGCDVKWKNVAIEISRCFPDAKITIYEPVKEHVQWAEKALRKCKNITIVNQAVTARHLFEDNFGIRKRKHPQEMRVFRCLGKHACSYVDIEGTPSLEGNPCKETNEIIKCLTLDEVVDAACGRYGVLDYLKTDCEGAEVSFLGCASVHAISRIRYMAGEYHNFEYFYPVALKLMDTHYVYISGEIPIGSFFCERRTLSPKTMLSKTPNVKNYHMVYHKFNEEWLSND